MILVALINNNYFIENIYIYFFFYNSKIKEFYIKKNTKNAKKKKILE